jgi:Bacterial SH3 domain
MKNQLVAIGICLGLGIGSAIAPALSQPQRPPQGQSDQGQQQQQKKQQTCTVTDPTGTPLNVRKSPNGRVIGAVENGSNVRIVGSSKDNKGRPWAKIRGDSGATGWILREFVSCY